MLKINFTHKRKQKTDDEFASEVVEILEEKLEDMKIKLPLKVLEKDNHQVKFREDLRKELVYEISDFISCNKKRISQKVA